MPCGQGPFWGDGASSLFWLFVLNGTLSGLAAVLLTARIGSTRPNIALGWELEVITMVILGGVSIAGGSGTIPGVVIAVFVLGLVGYSLFSLALFDALMLFSLNQARRVVRALAPALVVNLLVGYIFSHALAVPYATVGLVLGGAWFAFDARRAVAKSLTHAEYSYYAV